MVTVGMRRRRGRGLRRGIFRDGAHPWQCRRAAFGRARLRLRLGRPVRPVRLAMQPKVIDPGEVAAEHVYPDAPSKVIKRNLVTHRDDAPNFGMRLFEVEAGGATDHHQHPWEHEVFIVSGRRPSPDGRRAQAVRGGPGRLRAAQRHAPVPEHRVGAAAVSVHDSQQRGLPVARSDGRGAPEGNRIPVSTLKGWRPRPLDDGGHGAGESL